MIGVISILVGRDPAAAGRDRSRGLPAAHRAGRRSSPSATGPSCSGPASPPSTPSCSAGSCTSRGLVPRRIPVIGLIGAPLFTSWIIGYILGVTEPGTAWHGIGVAPIFIWELSLGLWMTFKGFRKDAPLMVAAAAEDAGLDRRRRAPRRSPIGVGVQRQVRHDRRPARRRRGPRRASSSGPSGCCTARPTGSPGEGSASPGRRPAASSGCCASRPSDGGRASPGSRSSATTRTARTSSPWP